MIALKKYSDLQEVTKLRLNEYVIGEFGHIPIVNETEWAKPDWTIVLYEGERIACFYNIVESEIMIDNNLFKVGGINNVITQSEFRGNGYASKTLKDTSYFIFDDLKCDLGMLLCADNLIPFYERLNWYKVDCPVYFEQTSGIKLWKSNAMLLSNKEKLEPHRIDIKGLPW